LAGDLVWKDFVQVGTAHPRLFQLSLGFRVALAFHQRLRLSQEVTQQQLHTQIYIHETMMPLLLLLLRGSWTTTQITQNDDQTRVRSKLIAQN